MVAFTRLAGGDIEALAEAFGIGAVRSWSVIEAGTINSNFAIEADSGRYFLRINEGKSEADVRFEAELVAALAEGGVPTPVPRDVPWGDQHASLFPWVEGAHRELGEVTVADAEAVGAALGRLHEAGDGLPGRDGIYTFGQICARYERFSGSDDPELAPAIAALGEEVDWLRARADTRAAASRGIIHGDLFRDNVLFRDDGAVWLIDFEQASTGSFVYDIAVCINAWCYVDDFDAALATGLCRGYRAVRSLGDADRAAFYVELRAAAMRFTVTRITDVYLAGTGQEGKDFRRYLERLLGLRAIGEAEAQRWL